MEAKTNSSAITTTAIVDANKEAAVRKSSNDKNKKPMDGKKKRNMNLIKVALFMLRRRSNGKSTNSLQVDVASKGMWKKLVGSIRPLHLQDNQSPPRHALTEVVVTEPPVVERYEDVLPPPMSPHGQYSPSSSSSAASCDDGMSSRYASALNLQELDKSNDSDDHDDDHGIDELGGDLMIDAKAEEFIAHFYEQMRIQQVGSIHRYNRGMR